MGKKQEKQKRERRELFSQGKKKTESTLNWFTALFYRNRVRPGAAVKKNSPQAEPIKKRLSLFFGILGWVGLGWVGGGDMFILSLRLSVLVFSNWRWFEEKKRANKKISSLSFGILWLGWVGLGWRG